MNFIFDLYGTLADIWTDEKTAQFWRKIASYLGDGENKYRSVKNEYIRLCKKEEFGEGREFDLLRVFEKMLAKRNQDISMASEFACFFRDSSMVELTRFPYIKEMLIGLKERGAKVFLLSNAQSCFTRKELDTLELTDLFDDIIISSEVSYKKPSKEIFEAAFKKFGIKAEESIYVGNDMYDDVMGAHNSGMKTVYIETRQSRKYDNLTIPYPDYIATDHYDLKYRLFALSEERKNNEF